MDPAQHASGADAHPTPQVGHPVAHPVAKALHSIDQQRLRILRCTAQALVHSLGGLRFKADSQPWLLGLTDQPHPMNAAR